MEGSFRSFEKGLADRRGWREEILQKPEIQASFLYHFPYAPLGEGGHISGELFWLKLSWHDHFEHLQGTCISQ